MIRSPLSARPLLDTEGDAALFVPLGRALDDLVRATDRGHTALLHGARGSGRTTMLRALLRHRRTQEAGPTVFVQAARARDPLDALTACLDAARETLDEHDATDVGSTEAPPEAPTVTSTLHALGRVCAGRAVTFLVDNLDPHVAHRLFGLGRDELWELEATFVVTALDEDLPLALAPPADAFFEVRVAIPAPTREEAEALLARRLGRPVPLPSPPSTPRAAIDAARRDPEDPASADALRRRRLDDAAAIGPTALGIAHLLDEVGGVSAADAIARDRLGVSAARVSQVLAQMYDGGIVTFEDVRDGGPGRPRRRYRWAEPDTPVPSQG
ncbi:hypothetical protein [Mobilicoccus pelagius]|uniref:Orc1-like AAA ATPase domain-containing protein n=1 Tax=Mobilicoccus pelagius NBRC 104925 TaxID=1089455 RepID=H5USM5_9MICO|nr:hypothetical protein [Mobilicoccus pelagius]GAB48733.1 hypothetical protein MOPEL_080_00120 [Mobilicoccus pelagius NBRC 104925]